MAARYGNLMLSRALPGKVNPHVSFYRWINRSMWCSSCLNTFVVDTNLQIIWNKLWCEYLMCCFWMQFHVWLSFFMKLKHMILGDDYMKKNFPGNWASAPIKTNLSLVSYWFYIVNLYNFIFQRLILKMISAYILWLNYWTFKEWKTAKIQDRSQHANYLHKWLFRLNFDMFTAAMFIFFLQDSKYVQA